MASLYVRDMVRSWCRDPAMNLPFVDTINLDSSAPEWPQWSTLSFVNAFTQTATYCGTMTELGVFDYMALGRPGIGDAGLLAAAEADVGRLLANIDRRLTLVRATPPTDFLQAGTVPWYTVSFAIDYFYSQPLWLPSVP